MVHLFRSRRIAVVVGACGLVGLLAFAGAAVAAGEPWAADDHGTADEPESLNEELRSQLDPVAEQKAEDEFLADEARRSEPMALVSAGYSPGYYFAEDGTPIVRAYAGVDGIQQAAEELEHPVIIEPSRFTPETHQAASRAVENNVRLSEEQWVGGGYEPEFDLFTYEGNVDPEEFAERIGFDLYRYYYAEGAGGFWGGRSNDSTP